MYFFLQSLEPQQLRTEEL